MEKMVVINSSLSEEKIVGDYEPETIKKAINGRKDFWGIYIENYSQDNYYFNGVIMSFDETLTLIRQNPKYLSVVSDIRKYKKSLDEKEGTQMAGYNRYPGEILFLPYTEEFQVIDSRPKLITDIIPGFVVDTSLLNKIKDDGENHFSFFTKYYQFLMFFDKFVRIFPKQYYIGYATFDFRKLNFGYDEILEFLYCYEAFFQLYDKILYEDIKKNIISDYAPKQSSAITQFSEVDLFDKTPSEILGISQVYTRQELKLGLERTASIIQNQQNVSPEEKEARIEELLDIYNSLLRNATDVATNNDCGGAQIK